MGNCVFGGGGGGKEVIKVIRSNGGIMEFNAATTAESITDEFPGHAIFPSNHLFWKPIPHHQLLLPGNSYYLLPIIPDLNNTTTTTTTSTTTSTCQLQRLGHIRSNTTTCCTSSSAAVAPYRMSFHHHTRKYFLKTTTYSSSTQDDQLAGRRRPRGGVSTATNNNNYNIRNCGIWKVKLVISPQQLVQILSQQVPTQDLINSVRTVAKCGIHYGSDADDSSLAFSHHWTLSTTSSKLSSSN